jgi:hypothetical protein
LDRERGEVRLIPNLRFRGESEVFALVVPTPARPELELASRDIWDEAFRLTAPAVGRRFADSSPFGCSDEDIVLEPGLSQEDVAIHGRETLGGFEATIISSGDPDALVGWLQENGFEIRDEDAAKFGPFVERGWFFTAMKPDTSAPGGEMPPGGWDNNVDPIMFVYEAGSFELPVPLLSINRAETLPVVVYAVDDHRTTFEGFQTAYANKINARESAEIAARYPTLAPFLPPGRFLTRLQKTYVPITPMDRSLVLERASGDEEFRRTTGGFLGGIPLELALLSIPLLEGLRRRGPNRRRRS